MLASAVHFDHCWGRVPGLLPALMNLRQLQFRFGYFVCTGPITFLVKEKALLGQRVLSYWASTGLMMYRVSQTLGASLLVAFLCFYLIIEFDNFGIGFHS